MFNNNHSLCVAQNQIKSIETILFGEGKDFVDLNKVDCDRNYDASYDNKIRPRRSFILIISEELVHLRDKNIQTASQYIYQLEEMIFDYEFYRDLIIKSKSIPINEIYSNIFERIKCDINFIEQEIHEEDYHRVIADCGIANMPKTKQVFLQEMEEIKKSFLKKL